MAFPAVVRTSTVDDHTGQGWCHSEYAAQPNPETGVLHIQKIPLNRAALVTYHLAHRLIEAARDVRRNLLQRFTQLEHQVQALTERLERLGRGDPPSA